MTRIVGLDPSTASFGIALPDGSCRTIKPRAGAAENVRRLNEITYRLDAYLQVAKADVAMMEEAIPPRFSTAALRLGEVRGTVFNRLFERGILIVQIKPSVLKQYATGKGNADKDAMMAAAEQAGAIVANSDESDAWWLWALGRHGYHLTAGEPGYKTIELREVRNRIRARVAWPRFDARVSGA